MNILGLGNVGCLIAKQFAKYKQFSVHLVDTENHGGSCAILPEYTKAEDYEQKYVNLPFQLEDDLTLILCGDELMCCSSLRILEQYRNLELNVIYIKPDTKFLNQTQIMVDRVVYSVLQELTRSAKISSMFLVDFKNVSDIIGKVSLKDRETKLHETVATAYYMKNMFDNIESVLDKTIESPATFSIKTFGVMDLQSGEEKFFYPLDEIREKRYSYYISKTKLDSDVDLSDHIEHQISSKFKENLKVSYAVYESPLEQSSVYIEIKTPYIQT